MHKARTLIDRIPSLAPSFTLNGGWRVLGKETARTVPWRRYFVPARLRTRAMIHGFSHCASGKRNLAIGLRSTVLTRRRAFSSALSVPERAINAEPAYASLCASARASKARGAFVLRSRAVPMIKNKSSVKHFVLSQVLLRPLLYFEETSLETMPSSWRWAQAWKNAAASPVNSSLNRKG